MRRSVLSVLRVVFVTVAALGAFTVLANPLRAQPSMEEGVQVGDMPYTLDAQDLQGQTHRLEAYKGKVVVLHFWATWCPYCRQEIPKLKQVLETHGDAVQILSVSVDEDLQRLKDFVAKEALPYPVIADAEQDFRLAQTYAVSGIPVTYILNTKGQIAKRDMGPSDIVTAVALNLE